MAEIAKGVGGGFVPSHATKDPGYEHRINGLYAGEAIAAGDACRIDATDGKVYRASGAAANANAKVKGFAAGAASANEAVTLLHGVMFGYKPRTNPGGVAPAPSAPLYLSATVAGGLSDAATTGGSTPIAFNVDGERIFVGAPQM